MMFLKDISLKLYQDDMAESSESPVESIKKIAENEVKKQRTLELAIVKNIYPHKSSKDNDNYECDVELKNGGSELRKVPILTPHIGFTWVPNVNDLVLIGYIGGNVNSPVVIGSLYNDDQRPPLNNANKAICEAGKGGCRSVKYSFAKDHILFVDSAKGWKWDAGDIRLVMAIKKQYAALCDKSNAKNFFIGGSTPGDVAITASDTILVTATADKNLTWGNGMSGNEQVLIKADKSIRIESGDEIVIKAKKVTIKSDTDMSVDAANVSVAGKSSVKIESSGTASLKANVQLDLQGNPVNIN